VTGRLQAVIFDFDGVIADSEPLHLRAFQQALQEDGLQLDRDEYFARYLGFDDVGVFATLGRDRGLPMDEQRIRTLVTRKGKKLQAMLDEGHVLFPGAAAFIREAAAVVPIAIASGALRHEILEITEAADLTRLFSTIVASGDTPESKPSPAPYQLAFTLIQQAAGRSLDPSRCVAIEDSAWGLESARGAGLRCVGVTTSYAADQLRDAELIVEGLRALTIPALEQLCGTNLSPR
jgi:HAD superfamily hydrolase (TIGR01509 family)